MKDKFYGTRVKKILTTRPLSGNFGKNGKGLIFICCKFRQLVSGYIFNQLEFKVLFLLIIPN
jgi:hypothetical protein